MTCVSTRNSRCEQRHEPGPGPDQDGAALAAVKDAARRLRRWPAAILDRAHARHPCIIRPGRRNGPDQPNKETSPAKAKATFAQLDGRNSYTPVVSGGVPTHHLGGRLG